MTAKLCALFLHLLLGRLDLRFLCSASNQPAKLRNYQHKLLNRQPFGAFRWLSRCAALGYNFGFQPVQLLALCCDPSRYILQSRRVPVRMVWLAA